MARVFSGLMPRKPKSESHSTPNLLENFKTPSPEHEDVQHTPVGTLVGEPRPLAPDPTIPSTVEGWSAALQGIGPIKRSDRQSRALDLLVKTVEDLSMVKPPTALAAVEALLSSPLATPEQRAAALGYLDRVLDGRVLIDAKERVRALELALRHG